MSVSKSALMISLAGTTGFSTLAYAHLSQETQDPAERIYFEADTITRKDQESPIIASGNVQAYYGERFLTSDEIVYNPDTDIVIARGNVALTEADGQTFFANEVELTGDLADGIASDFSAMLAGDARIAGTTVVKNGDTANELSNAVYTGCKICEEDGSAKTPTWQIKSRKVIQDRENQTIRFNNALVEMFGVPVFYTPYLQMPDPSVERQSGLLTPSFGNSSRLGNYVEIPYYFAISDYQDATFSPKFMSELGTLLQGEYRIQRHNGRATVQAGFIGRDDGEIEQRRQTIADDRGILIDQVADNIDIPGFRFHLFTEAARNFGQNWLATADIDYVSDKFYLRSYKVEPEDELKPAIGARPDRLAQKLGLTRRTDDSVLQIDALGFQDLNLSQDNAFLGNALPRISYKRDLDSIPVLGGNATLEANVLSLIREEGFNTYRGVLALDWKRIFTSRGGHRFEFYGQLRGDAYRQESVLEGNEACNASVDRFAPEFRTQARIDAAIARRDNCLQELAGQGQEDTLDSTRFLPTAGVQWSYPLFKQTENATFIIEPKAQLVVSPDEDFSDEIIDEDSRAFQLDATSLYDWNKSAGFDFWESGQRINFGVAATAVFNNGFSVEGEIGQQLRFEETDAFENAGLEVGLGDTSSDIVAALDVNFGSLVNFKNSFQIDQGSGEFRRVESTLNARYKRFGTAMNYLKVQRGDFLESGGTTLGGTDLLRAGASYQITDQFATRYRISQDLEADRRLNETYELVFTDECTRITLAFTNDFTRSDGFETDRSITFNIELLGLGN